MYIAVIKLRIFVYRLFICLESLGVFVGLREFHFTKRREMTLVFLLPQLYTAALTAPPLQACPTSMAIMIATQKSWPSHLIE